MRFKITLPILLMVFLFAACSDDGNKFPETPGLEYRGFEKSKTPDGRDSSVFFRFRYTDGDGDIGLSESDTLPPFDFGGPNFYNFLVQYFVWDNGVARPRIDPLTLDTLSFHLRLPVLTPSGTNKQIEGELKVEIPARPSGFSPDSILIRCRLSDRALRKSAFVSSPVVPLFH
ncbi:MAG: hypothetical protein ACK5U7_03820 [Bacteroidota bacterium]|jgi:hypothetical protein